MGCRNPDKLIRFIYTVWFRDGSLPPDDQDHEWPAVIEVVARSPEEARSWGDHLAIARAARAKEVFLRSSVTDRSTFPPDTDWRSIPVIEAGREASDDVIGW